MMFDVWTIIHIAFWIVFGANYQAIQRARGVPVKFAFFFGTVLALAYSWEILEWLILEPVGYSQYPEGWLNRWISDPLVGLLSAYIGVFLVRDE